MSVRKPLVIVTRKLPEAVETRMRELFDARLNHDDTPMSAAALAEAMATAEVLVPTITDRIDAALIAKAGPKLKLIANSAPGWTISTSRRPPTGTSPSPTRPAC